MKQAVIFDLDGLLINSEIISFKIYQDLTAKYHQHISMEEYIHDYSGKTEIINIQALIGTKGLPISVEEGLMFVKEKEKEYFQQGVALKPGAEKLLRYLKQNRYKTVLASSSTRERALEVLRQNGIETFFDAMVFGTEVKRGKPHPDIFIKACEYAGKAPSDSLVLEDSEAGIQAAYSAGIDVICIPDMKMPGAEFHKMTAAVMDSLEDVLPWLENEKQPEITKQPEII